MVTNAQVVKALQAGKSRIQEFGWVKCWGGDEAFGFCAAGALRGSIEKIGSARRVLCAITPRDTVTAFNDEPDTTKEDILQLYDAAIELARGPRY